MSSVSDHIQRINGMLIDNLELQEKMLVNDVEELNVFADTVEITQRTSSNIQSVIIVILLVIQITIIISLYSIKNKKRRVNTFLKSL